MVYRVCNDYVSEVYTRLRTITGRSYIRTFLKRFPFFSYTFYIVIYLDFDLDFECKYKRGRESTFP